MPHIMMNEKDEEIYFGDKQPTAQQDHTLEHVWTERTPMGSKAPVYTVKHWRSVFNPALKATRLAEEKAQEKALLQKQREAAIKELTDTGNKMTVKELNAELKEMKALQPSLVNLPKKAKKADLVREMVRVYMKAADLGLTVVVEGDKGNSSITLKKDTTGDAQ